MYWYNRAELQNLFKEFSAIDIKAYGNNFGMLSRNTSTNGSGYLWLIEATK